MVLHSIQFLHIQIHLEWLPLTSDFLHQRSINFEFSSFAISSRVFFYIFPQVLVGASSDCLPAVSAMSTRNGIGTSCQLSFWQEVTRVDVSQQYGVVFFETNNPFAQIRTPEFFILAGCFSGCMTFFYFIKLHALSFTTF